jgi:hypothetical protein
VVLNLANIPQAPRSSKVSDLAASSSELPNPFHLLLTPTPNLIRGLRTYFP